MYKDLFNGIMGQVDELQLACEKQEVYYKTMITTHEVTIGQQTIQLKKAQEVVSDNIDTILRLQEELETSNLEIKNLQIDVKSLQDQLAGGEIGLSTGVIEVEDNPFPEKKTPVPYPYTTPIRDIPDYSRIKVKK